MVDKVDLSFKKLIGKEYTTTAKEWYEEFSTKEFNLHAQDIWVDTIPSTPPVSGTSVIYVYDTLDLVEDITVGQHKSWLAKDPGSGERLGNFIPPRYGQGYTVRVYDALNNEIPTTDGSQWYFDYTNGILTFDNDPSVYGWDTSGFKIKVYRYIGQTVEDVNTSSGTYSASDIVNDSTVSGSTVQDALDNINTANFVIDRMIFNEVITVISGVVDYNLANTPIERTVQVFLNGLLQRPGSIYDYTISGTTIHFLEPLNISDNVLVNYIIK